MTGKIHDSVLSLGVKYVLFLLLCGLVVSGSGPNQAASNPGGFDGRRFSFKKINFFLVSCSKAGLSFVFVSESPKVGFEYNLNLT